MLDFWEPLGLFCWERTFKSATQNTLYSNAKQAEFSGMRDDKKQETFPRTFNSWLQIFVYLMRMSWDPISASGSVVLLSMLHMIMQHNIAQSTKTTKWQNAGTQPKI